MRFSWSLCFAQEVDEEAVTNVLPRALLLRDRERPMILILDRDSQETRHYVCVDNVGVIGSNVGIVGQRMEEVVESFEKPTSRNSTPESWRRWESCLTGNGSIRESRDVGVGRFVECSWSWRVAAVSADDKWRQ